MNYAIGDGFMFPDIRLYLEAVLSIVFDVDVVDQRRSKYFDNLNRKHVEGEIARNFLEGRGYFGRKIEPEQTHVVMWYP